MAIEQRPKIKIKLTQPDAFLEMLGWATLGVLWFLTLYNYSSLPSTIPTHFNASGQIDNYGSKSTILILPIIGTVIFVGMTLINKIPHSFNYPRKITPENAEIQYTYATKMIRYLKLMILIVFSSIVYITNLAVASKSDGAGIWFVPVIVGSIFMPVIYFIIKMIKAK